MKYKTLKRYEITGHAHELTFSTYNQQPFLSNKIYCELLVEALLKAKGVQCFHLWAYVFMPEHVHLLVWFPQKEYSVGKLLKSVKQSVSRKAIAEARENNPFILKCFETWEERKPYYFWTPGGGFDRNLVEPKTIVYSVNYIHRNPVRRGLAENPEDWYWSSYREWKEEGAGPLAVDRESFPVINR